jgi:hypothetical protein
MEKHFYKKIYIITLCTFWHRSYPWPNTQHIQKLATEDLYILRYCRSRFFTFVFLMQKLSGISSDKNNKSCRIIHHESNKIGFTFFWCFCDFLCNLQESAKLQHYWRYTFARKPLERFGPLQCGPWPWPAAREGQIPTTPVRGLAGKGCGEEGELTRDRFATLHGVEGLPRGGQQRRAAATAGATAPASWGGAGCVWARWWISRGCREGMVGWEDRGAGRGDELGDSLPWRTAATLPTGWCCVPSRGTAAAT